jgi:hypothetical protein
MKQVLNFTLEDVLLPQSDRFQPYMQEVVPFLTKLSNQLSSCVSLALATYAPLSPSSIPVRTRGPSLSLFTRVRRASAPPPS